MPGVYIPGVFIPGVFIPGVVMHEVPQQTFQTVNKYIYPSVSRWANSRPDYLKIQTSTGQKHCTAESGEALEQFE